MKYAYFNVRECTTIFRSLQEQFDLEKNMLKKSVYNKALGYKWNTQEYYSNFELQNLLKYDEKNNGATKRKVLKAIKKMYDLIVFLNPLTVTAIIQNSTKIYNCTFSKA